MARSGVSKEQVIVAAQTILRRGENPTVFRVREALQPGSHLRYLNECKSEVLLSGKNSSVKSGKCKC